MVVRLVAFALVFLSISHVPAQAAPEAQAPRYYIFSEENLRNRIFLPGRQVLLGAWTDNHGEVYYAAIGLDIPRLYIREVGEPIFDRSTNYYYFSEEQVNIARRNLQYLREEIRAARNRRSQSSCDDSLQVRRRDGRPTLINGNRQ